MNQELIDMAREAGWEYAHGDSGYEPLWKFAALVAAAEREKFCAVLRQLHDSYLLASRSNNIRAKGETK